MGTNPIYDAIIKNIEKNAQAAFAQMSSPIRAPQSMCDKYLAVVEKRIREIFKDAVDSFYNDRNFTPHGEYQRNYSLYNILVIERSGDGRGLKYGFDPSRVTPFWTGYVSRSDGTDGLYAQAFKYGWHGGAGSVSIEKVNEGFEPHPQPASGLENQTPYWRSGPYYSHWYHSPAPVADPSPLQYFNEHMQEFMQNEAAVIWAKIVSGQKII